MSRFYLRKDQSDPVYAATVELHERVRDVQARQCLAMERAAREASADGFDWLLHVDADEALLLPRQRDARGFFAAVPEDFEQVVFNNLEAVPESLEVQDWFRDVSLFKVHHAFLREAQDEVPDVDDSGEGQQRRERRERWLKRKLAGGADPDSLRKNRTFDRLMVGVRMARREAALDFDFDLPPPDTDSEPGDEGEDGKESDSRGRLRNALPSFFTAYANGKAACRLRRGAPPPLPIGVHRCASDGNAPLRNYRCNGAGDPVVLHYANCGFSAWRRKYELLASGHGTEDGGFSVTRKGINSMRAHLAHRDLLRRGSPAQLEEYYRTYVMGNEFGELPHFACHGLVARTRAVAGVIRAEAGA